MIVFFQLQVTDCREGDQIQESTEESLGHKQSCSNNSTITEERSKWITVAGVIINILQGEAIHPTY